MMEFVKVIRAKMGQYSPAKSGDFEKVGPKSFQFKESMFLSFLRTKSAENLFRVSGQTGGQFHDALLILANQAVQGLY